MTASFTTSPPAALLAKLPRRTIAVIVALGILIVCQCARLWPEWTQNPDLTHGFLAPLIFLLLVWESRRQGPQHWLESNRWTRLLSSSSALAGFIIFGLGGLLAASVAWTHALVLFTLTLSLCCFLFAGLLMLADARVRVVPINWISLTAVLLWLLVAPLPSGTYARLTSMLQSGVTSAVFQTLHLFGIPARQQGNVIELATATVGVEEACSGIRSLLSCLYAGFFIAAWQLRQTSRRLVLICVAPLLALVMNFFRSLLLTLLANAGKDIRGFWHDATGFAILAVTTALLVLLADRLETKPPATVPTTPSPLTATRPPIPWIFWLALSASFALGLFYFSHSRPARNDGTAPPDLAALLPNHSDGWQVTSANDLARFSGVLQTAHLAQRTYLRPQPDGRFIRLTVYLAYWPAGATTVSRVTSHTPDACWPGSGWTAKPSLQSRQTLPLPDGKLLRQAEHRLFQNHEGIEQHVWFWHVYDGRLIDYQDPYSVPTLIKLALKYGFRHQGDQFFVRISSNLPWSEIANESLVAEISNNVAKLGL